MAQNYKNSKLQEKLAGLSAKTTNKITEISKKEKDFENQWMQPSHFFFIIFLKDFRCEMLDYSK